MSNCNSSAWGSQFEGAFSSCNPRTQILAGPDALVAGVGSLLPAPGGLIVGRFAWSDAATGRAYNAQADAGATPTLGLVLPTNGTWQRIYWLTLPDGTRVRVLRAGLPVTLCRRGDFWLRFAGGSYPGQPVYASLIDGQAIAGYSVGAALTPFTTLDNTPPGGLGRVSSWSTFS